MNDRILFQALTFDDVLLVPKYSTIIPRQAQTTTNLTKKIKLNIPFVSASMDTVTEAKLAIAMAIEGGMGFIHKNMSAQEQANNIQKVKQAAYPADSSNLVTKDAYGKLSVGAAVGITQDVLERVKILEQAGVDAISIDAAHGHSKGVMEVCKLIKKQFPSICLIAGNVVTQQGAEALIQCGIDAIKVGIGAGSICTTRIVAGIGIPQLSAIFEVAKVTRKYHKPLIADGGIRYAGDITKALAAGADCVMLGSLLAGTDEAPGDMSTHQGKQYKVYRGMGSLEAMQAGSKDRYGQEDVQNIKKLVPEGITGKILYKGTVSKVLTQLIGGLKAGMGYCGCLTIPTLQSTAQFVHISSASRQESHPHTILQ